MSAQTILVVGGGIVGVFAALRARQLRPQARIMLVEQDEALGGLLRSDRHPNGLSFDRGTHVLSETGVESIDALLFHDLDEAAWRRFGGPARDLAGLLLDDAVLEGSPFLPAPRALVEERLAARAGAPAAAEAAPGNLHDALVARYGARLADAVFRTPVRNLYRCELEELDVFVTGQLPLSRIVTDDMSAWLSRMADDDYRRLVACPDQLRLPRQFTSPLGAIYPRRMGVGRLFDNLARRMCDARIELRLSARIAGVTRAAGVISAVRLEAGSDGETIEGGLNVVWAVPPFQLLAMLGLPRPASPFKAGWRTIIIDFCASLTRPLGCYYYIDYGDNDSFRLTNYAALSEEAAGRDAAPFTCELWWRGGEIDEAEAHRFMSRRFMALSLVEDERALSDVRIRRVAQGAPFATTENMRALAALAETVASEAPANLVNVGMLSQPGLFFTSDLLRNAETRLNESLL